jgi:hypothetical protein
MANTKKRRRRSGGSARAGTPTTTERSPQTRPPTGGANPVRRERKEQARRAREAARKRAARAATIRRATTFAVVGLVAFGVLWWLQRVASPRPIPQAAIDAATAAGCSSVETPASSAPGGLHLQSGQEYTYDQHPATSGYHDPSPLDLSSQRVYDSPVPETRAVHNLEHGAVIAYYRQDGADKLPQEVVDRLASLMNRSHNVLLAPYPDLPAGDGLAIAAWNKLQTCPSTVTPGQAATMVNGFIEAYLCSSNAPEGNVGDGC